MWYDKRWMRAWFYIGTGIVIIGVGIVKLDPDYRLAGALTMCLGASLMIFGFFGIMINIRIEEAFRKKRKRSSSQQR